MSLQDALPLKGHTRLVGGFGRHYLQVPTTGELVDLGCEASIWDDEHDDVYLVLL